MSITQNGVPVIDASALSLYEQASVPELQFMLWWYSGGYYNQGTSAYTSAGEAFISKGSTSPATSPSSLIVLDSTLASDTLFAFEVGIQDADAGNVALWDITASAVVAGSEISWSAELNYIHVLRSGQFALTPGHSYGITAWNPSGTSYFIWATDASLIVFPS